MLPPSPSLTQTASRTLSALSTVRPTWAPACQAPKSTYPIRSLLPAWPLISPCPLPPSNFSKGFVSCKSEWQIWFLEMLPSYFPRFCSFCFHLSSFQKLSPCLHMHFNKYIIALHVILFICKDLTTLSTSDSNEFCCVYSGSAPSQYPLGEVQLTIRHSSQRNKLIVVVHACRWGPTVLPVLLRKMRQHRACAWEHVSKTVLTCVSSVTWSPSPKTAQIPSSACICFPTRVGPGGGRPARWRGPLTLFTIRCGFRH